MIGGTGGLRTPGDPQRESGCIEDGHPLPLLLELTFAIKPISSFLV